MLGFIQVNKTEVDFMKTCIFCDVMGTWEKQRPTLVAYLHYLSNLYEKGKICSDMHCVDMS